MKVIITGSTGMVGKGVLMECLKNEKISEVLSISRRPSGLKDSKLVEIIHNDFFDLSEIEEFLSGFDACFFCLGITSFRMNEEDYKEITYNLTMNFANTLLKLNKNMVFNYVSGAGTDATEKGSSMWARVKGKTENDLRSLGFLKSYGIRPGMIQPQLNLPTQTGIYKIFMPLLWVLSPLFRLFASNSIVSTAQIAKSMIKVSELKPDLKVLEPKDINFYAK